MQGKVVVITGASGGIGAALARLLATRGASLVLVARREAALRSVAEQCGGLAYPIVADATDRDQVRRVVEESAARFGHIDVWVNNVGRGIFRDPSLLTDDDLDEMMRINVKSALYGMQEVLPHFKARGAGHVINISSMLGRIPFASFRSAYNGAKHFLNALTANFRTEVQRTHPGIQFSLVSSSLELPMCTPGREPTPAWRRISMASGWTRTDARYLPPVAGRFRPEPREIPLCLTLPTIS
jgi:NADP-dependent 3-hydroxy acid dehydrogenase YdfG